MRRGTVASKFQKGSWALILGGSSGFGLATAQKLAEHGLNLFVVHRDRRSAMRAIEPVEHMRGVRTLKGSIVTGAPAAALRVPT